MKNKKILIVSLLIAALIGLACANDGSSSSSSGGSSSKSAGDVTTNTVSGVTFKMVYVPGGLTTPTGTTDASQATVANAYEIAETEVTYELWSAVYTWATTDAGGGLRADGGVLYSIVNAGVMGDGTGDTNQHPVTTINWRDAMVWTNALTEYMNAINGTSLAVVYTTDAAYTTPIRTSTNSTAVTWDAGNKYSGTEDEPYVNPNANGFRLPNSDEWELAARYIEDANGDGDIMDVGEYYPGGFASGATADYTYPTETGLVSWYSVNSGSTTHVIGDKTANALGLYDMNGNVQEWSFDWSNGGGGGARLVRGGSWGGAATDMQVGAARKLSPSSENIYLGFRLAARSP